MDTESIWDKRLQIRTTGRDEENADRYRYPYEPTPYCVLERLSNSCLIGKDDVLLDYGCGKGRVDFFLAHQTGASTIGVEYDERICQSALENRKAFTSGKIPEFVLTRAENYEVPLNVTCCYFFNPFSLEILRKVMARILESYYENPRKMRLFFYYPSEAYLSYLMTLDELEAYDEIACGDLFQTKSTRERIVIFSLPGYEVHEN